MLRQNMAYTTSNIANNSIPTFGIVEKKKKEGLLDALQAGADNYFKYSDLLSKKADEDQNRELKKGLLDALADGDQEKIDKAYSQFDPVGYMDYLNKASLLSQTADRELQDKKELMGLANQYDIALQNIKNKGLSNGGFGNTQAGLALRIASNPTEYGEDMQNWASNYLASNSSSSLYDKAYQGAKGRKDAEKEIMNLSSTQSSANENDTIDAILSSINENPELVGPWSKLRTGLSRYSSGKLGYDSDQLMKRGTIIRQLGNVQNNLIAKAKSAGQSGINTLSEIQQTTKGLDENSSPEEITGALNELKRINNDIISGKAFGNRNIDPKVQEALSLGYTMDEINKYLGVR